MKKRVASVIEPRYPLYLVLMLVFALLSFFFASAEVAIAELVICGLTFLFYKYMSHRHEQKLQKHVEGLINGIRRSGRSSLANIPMASVILNYETSEVMWSNVAFEMMAGNPERIFEQKLFALIPEFDISWVGEGKNECPTEITINDKIYRVYGHVYRGMEKEEVSLLLQLYSTAQIVILVD